MLSEKNAPAYSSSFHNLMEQSVRGELKNLIGESASEAVLVNFKLLENLNRLHDILSPVFKQGTPTLEKAIVKEMFRNMGESYEQLSDKGSDYDLYVSFAKKIFEERRVRGS